MSKHAKGTAHTYAQQAADAVDLVPRADYEILEALVHDLRERVEALENEHKR